MTERTIRHMAKELAGMFYEQAGGDMFGSTFEGRQRSADFRQTYPTLKHYMRGIQVGKDGRIKHDKPGWVYFVVLARHLLIEKLKDPNCPAHLKEAMYKALLEEHQKATSPAALEVLQRRINDTPMIA